MKRLVSILSLITSAVPAICLLSLAVLAAIVRLDLGHWPEPMHENYDSLISDFLIHISGYLLSASFGAPLIWIGFAAILLFNRLYKTVAVHSMLLICGWIALAIFWKYSPGDFMSWLLD